MQDILVVVAIAAAIFFLPRLMGRRSSSGADEQPVSQPRFQQDPNQRVQKINLTGRMRLAILLTILWIAGCAAFLKPWEGNTILLFFIITLGPVLILWGSVWVWFGYKKYRR